MYLMKDLRHANELYLGSEVKARKSSINDSMQYAIKRRASTTDYQQAFNNNNEKKDQCQPDII